MGPLLRNQGRLAPRQQHAGIFAALRKTGHQIAVWGLRCATIGPKNSVFGGNQTTNDTIVRLGDAIKLIGR